MASNHNKRSILSPREQRAWINYAYPDFSCRIRGGELICTGTVQPTDLNRVYSARIEYGPGRSPSVQIENPKLRRRRPDQPIPHTYSDDEPCLFYPSEWRADMKLAWTILPWLSMWLFYYESWLATGEWQGGGVHPAGAGVSWEAL